jgi:hypothetical protein
VLEDANEATERIMGKYHETRLLIAHIGMALPSHIIASRYECEETIWRNSLDLKSLHTGMPAVTDSTDETAVLIPGSMAFLQPSGELVLIVEAGMNTRSNNYLISSPGGAEDWIVADRLVPYPSSCIGQYNDDDVKSRSERAIKQKLIGLFKDGHSLMAVLAARSDWTGAMAASGGHFDSFGKKAVDSLLESKGVVPLGLPDTIFHQPEPNVPSPAPPGSLLFARYKVATCLCAEDLEIHVLHSTLHLSVHLPRLDPPMSRMMYQDVSEVQGRSVSKDTYRDDWFKYGGLQRGAWFRKQFYPQGIAILDWNSKFTGHSFSAVRYHQQMQQQNQENQYVHQREQAIQGETNRRLQQIAFGWVHAENQQELTAARSYFIENSMQCEFRGSLVGTYVQDLEEA